MDEIESKVCLDLSRIWNVNYSDIANMIHDYVERDIGKYGAKTWPKTRVYIKSVKIKSLKERLEEAGYDRRRTS